MERTCLLFSIVSLVFGVASCGDDNSPSELDAGSGTDTDTNADTDTGTATGADADTDGDSDSDTDSHSDSNTDSDTESGTETDTATDTMSGEDGGMPNDCPDPYVCTMPLNCVEGTEQEEYTCPGEMLVCCEESTKK